MDAALKTKIMSEVDRQFDDQTKVLADLVVELAIDLVHDLGLQRRLEHQLLL